MMKNPNTRVIESRNNVINCYNNSVNTLNRQLIKSCIGRIRIFVDGLKLNKDVIDNIVKILNLFYDNDHYINIILYIICTDNIDESSSIVPNNIDIESKILYYILNFITIP